MDSTMQALSPLIGGYAANLLGLPTALGTTVGQGIAANAQNKNTIDAYNQATQAQIAAYNNAIGVQNQFANNSLGLQNTVYNQNVARAQPYSDIGSAAKSYMQAATPGWTTPYNYQTYNQGPEQQSINSLMGSLGPQYIKTYGMSDYLNSPEYQLQLLAQKKYAENLGGQLSATGGYGSGTAANQLQQNALDSALAGYQTGLNDYTNQNLNNFNIQSQINNQALNNYSKGLSNQQSQANNAFNILNSQLNTGLNAVNYQNTAGTNLAGQNAVINMALANATSNLGVDSGNALANNILNTQTANNNYASQLAGLINSTGGAATGQKTTGGAGGASAGIGSAAGGGADITGLVGAALGGVGKLLSSGAKAVGGMISSGSGGSSAPSSLSGAVGGNNTSMPWQTGTSSYTSPSGGYTYAPTLGTTASNDIASLWTAPSSSNSYWGGSSTPVWGGTYNAPTIADKLANTYTANNSYASNPWGGTSISSFGNAANTVYSPPPAPAYTAPTSTYVPYQIPHGPPAGGYNPSNYSAQWLPSWAPPDISNTISNMPNYTPSYFGGGYSSYTPSYFGGGYSSYTPSYFGGGGYSFGGYW